MGSTILDEKQFAAAVNKAALTNADRQAAAISKADSYSFQIAHPEYRRTDKNNQLVNRWLTLQGITNPTYPDFAAAVDALNAEGLLEIDKTAKAPSTYKSPVTGRTYDSLDSLIAQERHAALNTAPVISDEEREFDNMPFDEFQARIKDAVRGEQLKANGLQTQKNGDAWITLHPEYVDSTHNAHLMKMQLAANGVSDNNASIEDYEIAAQQLRDAGLLTLSKPALAKQHAAEVRRLATEAINTPGTVFDNTTKEEMYDLPLEEVRRRAMLSNR